MAVGYPEEFIKSISIRNRDVSSEGLKSIGDLWAVFENMYFMFFFRFQKKNMTFYVFLKWRMKKS